MRHLVILRGPGSSGRKKFIEANGLEPWLVDQSMLEAVFAEPVTDPKGGCRTDPQQRQRLRRRVLSLLEEKMSRGALIVFQPTDTGAPYSRTAASASDKMTACAIEQARKHRYAIHIVDFTETCTAEDLQLRRQSAGAAPRPGEVERVIRHMRRRIGLPTSPDIRWHISTEVQDLLKLIEPPVIDLSRWQNIVAIGDIHGCTRTLSHLTDGFEVRDDTAYIMLGDYINKGPDSGGVLRALIDRFMPHENCHFLTGNHERPLSDWARGVDTSKKAFMTTGLPSLQASGLSRDDAQLFLERTMDAARFHWRGLDILATHGGFAQPPEALVTFSAEHFQLGTDAASFDVDEAWETNVLNGRIPGPEELIQIHGHRNPAARPINAGLGSFCLEESVDRGGPLRALALSPASDRYTARQIYIENRDIPQNYCSVEKQQENGSLSV